MKKLNCASCGAKLKIEDNKEYAICEHCGTKYKMNEDINFNVKMDDNTKEVINGHLKLFSSFSKIMIIPVIIFIIIFIVICILSFNIIKSNNVTNSNVLNNNITNDDKKFEENIENIITKTQENGEKSKFNFQFENSAGTKNGFFLRNILDDIIKSNKTYDRKVNLVFNNSNLIEENDILNIKQGLDDWTEYEVRVNYDDEGYVKEIVVNNIIK